MTLRHLVEGLMQATGQPNRCQLAWACDLEHSTIALLYSGKAKDMDLSTFAKIHEGTRVPVEQMFSWYRLPEGAALPPVMKEGVPA